MNYIQLPADDGTTTLVASLLVAVAVLSVLGAAAFWYMCFGCNQLEKTTINAPHSAEE